MAIKIGSLLIELAVEHGLLKSGLTAAEKEVEKATKAIEKRGKDITRFGKNLSKSVTAPILAIAAATGIAVRSIAADAKEIQLSADVAGAGFEEFQRTAHAAMVGAGVESEKLGDILKDTADKIGDFAATGGGEMKDFFENIAAPQDLSVNDFIGKSSVEQLKLYVAALEKANVSNEEMVFYLESIADEGSRLLPILQDNGKELNRLGKNAAIIDRDAKAELREYTAAQTELATSMRKLTITVVKSGLVTYFTEFVKGAAELAQQFSEISPTGTKVAVSIAAIAAATGPVLAGLGGLIQVLAPVSGLFTVLGGSIAGVAAAALPLTAGIAAVVAAGYLIYTNWEKVAPILERAGAAIEEAVGPQVRQFVSDATAAFSELWQGPLGDMVRTAADWLLKFQIAYAKVLGTGLLRILDAAVTAFSGTFSVITDVLLVISRLLQGDFSGAWSAAQSLVLGVAKTFIGVFDALLPGVISSLRGIAEGAKTWLQDRLRAVFEWVIRKVGLVGNAFRDLYVAVVGNSYVPDMVNGIARELSRLDQVMVRPAQKSAEAVKAAMREMAAETQALLARLFPEIERARQMLADKALIQRSDLSADDKREAIIRLVGGRDRLNTSFDNDNGPLEEAEKVKEAGKQVLKELEEQSRKTKIQTVQIAESFRDMARKSVSALQSMVDAIQGGSFLDILGGAIDLFLQLGSTGVLGSGLADTINAPRIPGAANGTSFAQGGLTLVGERGPELAYLPRGGRVISNHDLRAANQNGRIELFVHPSGEFDARVSGVSARVVNQAAPAIASAGGAVAERRISRRQRRRVA
ncbi:MAG: hypothetical protein AAF494_00720 [Pseudomonadota bacterium]